MGKLKDKAKQVKTWISEHKEVIIGGIIGGLGAAAFGSYWIGKSQGYDEGLDDGLKANKGTDVNAFDIILKKCKFPYSKEDTEIYTWGSKSFDEAYQTPFAEDEYDSIKEDLITLGKEPVEIKPIMVVGTKKKE